MYLALILPETALSSIFTQIIQGKLPCHIIDQNEHFFAFLDINPIAPGHTLIVPKIEVDYFFDLDNTLLGAYLPFSKRIASAIQKSVPCLRVGMMVAGLDVAHAHLHLVPINGTNDLSFSNARKATPESLALMAKRITQHLSD